MIPWVMAVDDVLSMPPPEGTETWSYFRQGYSTPKIRLKNSIIFGVFP